MSKYYKAEDVIRAIAEQLCWEARTEYGDKFTTEDWLEEAEEYVSDLPTIEVSEDCISRKWLEENKQVVSHTNERGETEINEYLCWEDVEDAPSVVPTTEESSMVGEWIVADDESILFTVYKCSRCGKVHAHSPHNYCPNCGAKMKGADNE